ncbi:lipase family protein [Ningiella sp. W23]|uniref:lipase family protein n=1 Tax=Ningiella sp. W23 TaxID=3023715 RepID=UPI0037567AD5
MSELYFESEKLMQAPVERAAFSDRMAYVCAELSRLAYFPFEGNQSKQEVLEIVSDVIRDEDEKKILLDRLSPFLNAVSHERGEAEEAFNAILQAKDFESAEFFNDKGAEAFLTTRIYELNGGHRKKVAFLSFRGTQGKSWRDIKADVKANPKIRRVGNADLTFHSGFLNYYENLELKLINELAKLEYDQMFVTGHSLGGAMAAIATRLLPFEIRGACYTFGAPPIGKKEISYGLKTPTYQLINDSDMVPHLPNPWLAIGLKGILMLLKFLSSFFIILRPIFGSQLERRMVTFLDNISQYQHPSYVSYLLGSGHSARLHYNLRFYSYITLLLKRLHKSGFWVSGKKKIADHSITKYSDKLRTVGEGRN